MNDDIHSLTAADCDTAGAVLYTAARRFVKAYDRMDFENWAHPDPDGQGGFHYREPTVGETSEELADAAGRYMEARDRLIATMS